MNLFPKDPNQKIKGRSRNRQISVSKEGFLQNRISMDFKFKHGFVRDITLETFHQHPATFLFTKIQSIRPQTKNHEIHPKSQIFMNKREKGGEDGIQILQQ